MRIIWIYLAVMVIQVFGQNQDYCQSKQKENALITIACGENFEFPLSYYGFADDLVYQMTTDSDQQVAPPFTHLMRKTRYGFVKDEVIDMIDKNIIQQNNQYYCFIKSTQNEQTVYSLVNCQAAPHKEIIYSDIEFFIKREHCYQLDRYQHIYYIICKDDFTNQLELTIFNDENKLLEHILIPDVIIPPGSRVKANMHFFYFGVLINKGRMENNKYISESSQLSLFLYTLNSKEFKKPVLYKQYEVHSQPDDFITDFALYQELVYITRFKRGLTFRNLKIAWSEEIHIPNIKEQIFGVHIPKSPYDVSSSEYYIFLMLWGEQYLLFVNLQVSKTYQIQVTGFFKSQVFKIYQLKSEKVFNRKVVSSNMYIIFSSDIEFQVYLIDFTKIQQIILIYENYGNSRFYVINQGSTALVYEEENVVYILDIQLPKLEIVNLTEIQNPKLLQLKAQTYDNRFNIKKCQDIKVYYQVQLLDSTKIWPKFYNEKEENVFTLKYTKNELTTYVDLSEVFSGSALIIEEVNIINKQTKFTPSYFDITFQYDYILIDGVIVKNVDYAATCLFPFPSTNHKHYLFVKIEKQLFVMQCYYQSFQLCFKVAQILVNIGDVQDLVCVSMGPQLQVALVQKMQHGFVGQQIYAINFAIIKDHVQHSLYDIYQENKGNILSIIVFQDFQVFTKLSDDVYTINLRIFDRYEGIINVKSLELDCYKLFDLSNNQEYYAASFFLPMIKYKNFIYHITIELYNLENIASNIEYVGSILVGVTKKPTKERLQVQLTMQGIFILSVCDISEDEQSKQLLFIEKSILYNKLLSIKKEEISIKKFRTQLYPTFQLQKIQKIKTTKNFLYVYGSEINVPACIYIYRIYANQIDSLYHVIRPEISSFQVFNAISMKDLDLILISLNEFKRILINPIKFLNFTKSNETEKQGLNDDEVIDIKMKTLIPKDNNKIHDFQIKLKCTDCNSINNQG